jgi:hypothetical protein
MVSEARNLILYTNMRHRNKTMKITVMKTLLKMTNQKKSPNLQRAQERKSRKKSSFTPKRVLTVSSFYLEILIQTKKVLSKCSKRSTRLKVRLRKVKWKVILRIIMKMNMNQYMSRAKMVL